LILDKSVPVQSLSDFYRVQERVAGQAGQGFQLYRAADFD
jgi:hypothetical protein